MDRRQATWGGYAILILVTTTLLISILVPYGYFSVFFSVLIIIYQVLLRIIFTGPSKRSAPFSDKEWRLVRSDNDGIDIYGFINYQDKPSDMVVFIHGWQSSSEKYTERMQIFRDRGFHTMAVDMRGHGMAPDALEWTAGKVIQDIKIILEKVDQELVKKIHFYGHSLGGFICIGMHHDRHSGWWKDNYGTLILESPMVAYSKILEQMSNRISFMLPLLKRWTVRGFNKIHPELGGELEWKDVDIPHWGSPRVPILLLQAENDTKLGRFHYDLLLKQDFDIESYLVQSLPHSRNRVNQERDEVIVKWIESRMI